ncbi:MAG TPA: response regulator [Candidatus Binatia bacterium]
MPIVFLIDDDERVRRALVRLIRTGGYEVTAFPSAAEFMAEFSTISDAGCLILDVHMPGFSGFDLQRELRSCNASLPVIFITGNADVPMSVSAMKAGAVDFLPKPIKSDVLFAAIEQALERSRRDRAERADVEDVHERFETLTAREREVMGLVVQGLKNRAIAERLGTVVTTIKVHRGRVMDKMEVKTVPDLVRLAEKLGIPKKEKA